MSRMPLAICHTWVGMSMSAVVARSSSVKTVTLAPSDRVMMMARRVASRFDAPCKEPPTMIGKSVSEQGASVVRAPASSAPAIAVIIRRSPAP